MFKKNLSVVKIFKSLATLIFIYSSTFSYCQKTNKEMVTEKPFVLGVIDEIQSAELGEKEL